MLEIKNLSFAYPKQEKVLDHISLNAYSGEVLGILGPNGTGKTTFIKCINRIQDPVEGEVFLDGENLFKITRKNMARLIAYVPQFEGKFFPLSVIETVMMGRAPYAGSSFAKEDEKVVFSIIREMNLEPLAFRNIQELSGGERQRVLIARAMAQKPKVIILDEPTASMDPYNQLFILRIISDLAKKQGKIILMIIHDLNLASMFCDKLLMLKNGHIMALGTPSEVLTKENIQTMYRIQTVVTKEDGYIHVRLQKDG